MIQSKQKEDHLGMERCSSWKGKKILSEWKDDHLGKEKVILSEKERWSSRN
jgi:hypothetical protein